MKFKKYPKRRGAQKWKWIYSGPKGDYLAASRRYYTSRANALRSVRKFCGDLLAALVTKKFE